MKHVIQQDCSLSFAFQKPAVISSVSRDKFSVEKVPTLREAVEECIKHQLTIFFDVKGQPDKVLTP